MTNPNPRGQKPNHLWGKYVVSGQTLGEDVIIADGADDVLRAAFRNYPAINDAGVLHAARRRIAETVAFSCRADAVGRLESDGAFAWRLADQPVVVQRLLRLGPTDWCPMVPGSYPSNQPRLVMAGHLLGRQWEGSVKRVVVLDASTSHKLIGGLIELALIDVAII